VIIKRMLSCNSDTDLYSMSLSGFPRLACSCLIGNAVVTLAKHSCRRVVIL